MMETVLHGRYSKYSSQSVGVSSNFTSLRRLFAFFEVNE